MVEAVGIAVGHGVGFAPLPALLCGIGLLESRAFRCMPAFWLTPVASALAFCGFALVAAARHTPRSERRW